jgi:hypothetical protein
MLVGEDECIPEKVTAFWVWGCRLVSLATFSSTFSQVPASFEDKVL